MPGTMPHASATYSPEDDKLRLYTLGRLDAEDYATAKAAGFRYAPKQELFYAMWSPAAEDLLTEWAGEIGDEDTSLAERAEQRADRFDGYQTNRAIDAQHAEAGVRQLTSGIPFGQPILIGHHSEKRARRDAEKIENGMRKALKMWETSTYWEHRAKGALRAAKYKDAPAVRARRIKTLEAEHRKLIRTYTPKPSDLEPQNLLIQERYNSGESCEQCNRWRHEHTRQEDGTYSGKDGHTYQKPEPTPPEPHVWTGASRGGSWTPISDLESIEAGYARTVEHLANRIAYEKAMLGEQGESRLLEKAKRPKLPPLLNYDGEPVELVSRWSRERSVYSIERMTKAEYQKLYHESRYALPVKDGSHRVRIAHLGRISESRTVVVYLTDSKTHPRPEPGEPTPPKPGRPTPTYTPREPTEAESRTTSLREAVAEGVKCVSAPSLFVTPPDVVLRVMAAADVQDGHRVLEPSAGTGALALACGLRADCSVYCVEINHELADGLRARDKYPHSLSVTQADFMEYQAPDGGFDRVVMNPPFEKGQDRDHVRRAYGMLKPGGRLVAIMSVGPFQRDSYADHDFRGWLGWLDHDLEPLPANSFKVAGTGVNTNLVTLYR